MVCGITYEKHLDMYDATKTHVGDTIEILYDPGEPDKVVSATPAIYAAWVLVAVIFTIVMLAGFTNVLDGEGNYLKPPPSASSDTVRESGRDSFQG